MLEISPAAANNLPGEKIPAQVPSPGRACFPLLTLSGAAAGVKPAALTLDTCDVTLEIAAPGIFPDSQGTLLLKPQGRARDLLGEYLSSSGRYFPALLAGTLQITPASRQPDLAGVPAGTLLAGESARLNKDGHWRWERGQQQLRWTPRTAAPTAEEALACRALAQRSIALWPGALARRAGEFVFPRPYAPGHAPGFESPIPPHCLGQWALSAGAPARIDTATGALILDPDAAAGTSPQAFTVRASWSGPGLPAEGAKGAVGHLLAFNPALQPLVGDWRQSGEQGCAEGSAGKATGPLAQLELTADGRFLWRRQRFESRYDAWGRYSHDLPTGAVAFTVEGGNDTRGLQSLGGQAHLTNDARLELAALVFTPDTLPAQPATAATPACRWTFERQR